MLTLIRAILHWRMTRNPLYAVLLKHNFFYYACGLCESEHTHSKAFSHAHSCSESFFGG
jgi:hypothetical protein